MTVFRIVSSAVLASLLTNPAPAGEADPKVRDAIARALPFIRTGGAAWIEEKKCVSCHHVAFTTWALEEARGRGFEIDAAELAGWQKWSRDSLLEKRDDGTTVGSTNLEGVSQILWADRAGKPAAEPDPAAAVFLDMLTAGQRDDGSWAPGGQLPSQKRPPAETAAVSTMWNALALGTARGPAYEAARAKALAWLATQPDGVSTEFYAARLLLAAQSGDPTAEPAKKLLALQRPDGGWGWLTADDSDALATGLALYALRHTGTAPDAESVRRATAFLVESQTPDGSWTVRGTKTTAKDKPAATATYWGTCWATVALLSSVGER